MPASDLMTHLRESTRGAHAQLESLEYFIALQRGDLPVESYVGHLRAMAVLHAVMERQLSSAKDARLKEIWSESMGRFHRVQADLDFFAPRAVLDIPVAHDAAGVLAGHVLRRAVESPVSLLGYLYVLEGSARGAKVLAPLVGQAFGLDEYRGLAYLTWDPVISEARWRDFGARMNAVQIDVPEGEAIVEAACEAFGGLRQLFAALHPFDAAQLTRLVTSLNPEAGTHPVPTDPCEVEAAIRAGARSWQEFPYFAWRYGERGWRYTQSDGAWLVTLASLDQPEIDAQVKWLAGVLASRGMPSILLQRHLELLYEELRGRLPERPGTGYRKLLAAADQLADRRRAVITDVDHDAIVCRFEKAVGPDWRTRLPRIGTLLICAVADRAQGVEAAVSSLEPWLTDAQRFPQGWINAVREALKEVEAHPPY